MGLFDFFKKKEEPKYDPTNLKITDLEKGFLVDYDLKSWQVVAVYEYDWGNNNFTREYKLDSGDDVAFLHIEEDDELFLTFTRKIKVRSIDEDLPEKILKKEHPPKKIDYQGIKLYRENETPGYFKDSEKETDDWDELISWDYYDEAEEHVLNIEQWGEKEFEASFGKIAKEFEFSNILPPMEKPD